MQKPDFELNLAHLYPDLLNIYGDYGNILSIKRRCEWRDIKLNITQICAGDTIKSDKFDIFFAGGGQDTQQVLASIEFLRNKEELHKAANLNKPMLTICGSYQLFGQYYLTSDDVKIEGISIFDLYTCAGDKRFIGNVTGACDFLEPRTIVGFENHSGITYLGENVEPFLRVKVGAGNNNADKTEGARFKNVFGTYLHGPILPKNPHFCDYLISCALKNKYGCDIPLLELYVDI